MPTSTEAVVTLRRALDQAGDALASVHPDHLGRPTPCRDWQVGDLVAHLTAAPRHFLTRLQGREPDRSDAPVPPDDQWAGDFRSAADDLVHHWHQQGDDADAGQVDLQTAEVAVHTWDLARATGQPVDGLDPAVADRALSFLSSMLTDDNRGGVFGPPTPVADDAPVYDRLAAWAGRDVG